VIDELRADVTKTRKDGTRGRLRIDYADHRDPQAALVWLWKFVLCRAAGYAESALGGPRLGWSAGCGTFSRSAYSQGLEETRGAGRGVGSVRAGYWAVRCVRARVP
jgi:hypothetical protein